MLQVGQGAGAEQGRQLHDPTRRILCQQRHEALVPRSPAQPIERFQQGQIRFACAILLNALAMTNPQLGVMSQTLHKCLDHRRLPDARLARHKDYVSLPVQGVRVQAVEVGEFRLAPD